MSAVRSIALMFVVAAVALASGCGTANDPRTSALRQKFLATEEPAGAITIAESQQKLEPDGQVVAVGRIGASGIDPWAKGEAAFVISEAPEGGHADQPGHDAANCPFCKRRAAKADATALVQFQDEQGNVLPIDARQLLGVADNQVVVVQGRGRLNEVGMLVIAASKIHVRK